MTHWTSDQVSGRTLLIGFQVDSDGKPIEPNAQYMVHRSDEGELIICRIAELDEFNQRLKYEGRLN
jgi:hypothetical protein